MFIDLNWLKSRYWLNAFDTWAFSFVKESYSDLDKKIPAKQRGFLHKLNRTSDSRVLLLIKNEVFYFQ